MNINNKMESIFEILNESTIYSIPDYQRNYSWGIDEVEDLLKDITGISKEKYFLGIFFLCANKEYKEVVDGQQRLLTIFMIYNAIKEFYKKYHDEINDDKAKEDLKGYITSVEQLMFTKNRHNGKIVGSKVKVGKENFEFFKKYIVEIDSKNIDEKRAELISELKANKKLKININIVKAYETIKKYLEKITDDQENCIEKLKVVYEFQEKIGDYLEVLTIEVESEEDAFILFETINDRGLDLSALDLIKNKLFRNISGDKEFSSYKEKWREIFSIFNKSSEQLNYIKDYIFSANKKKVTKKNLFSTIKDSIGENTEETKKMIEELEKYANFYNLFFKDNTQTLDIKNNKFKEVMLDIANMNYEIVRPIILTKYRNEKNNIEKGDVEEFNRFARKCFNIVFRCVTVQKIRPSEIERIFVSYIIDLDEKKLDKEVKKITDDCKFKLALENLNIKYKSNTIYLILISYERSLRHEQWINPGRGEIWVEHILPQKFDIKTGEWIKAFGSKEICAEYVENLGNLALLGQIGQNETKNKPFNEKCKIYKTHTDMKSLDDVMNKTDWGRKEVDERKNEIIEKCVEIFQI